MPLLIQGSSIQHKESCSWHLKMRNLIPTRRWTRWWILWWTAQRRNRRQRLEHKYRPNQAWRILTKALWTFQPSETSWMKPWCHLKTLRQVDPLGMPLHWPAKWPRIWLKIQVDRKISQSLTTRKSTSRLQHSQPTSYQHQIEIQMTKRVLLSRALGSLKVLPTAAIFQRTTRQLQKSDSRINRTESQAWLIRWNLSSTEISYTSRVRSKRILRGLA